MRHLPVFLSLALASASIAGPAAAWGDDPQGFGQGFSLGFDRSFDRGLGQYDRRHDRDDDDYVVLYERYGYGQGYRDDTSGGYYDSYAGGVLGDGDAITADEYAIIQDYLGGRGPAYVASPHAYGPGPWRPLPPDLRQRLPTRAGYEWRVVDRDIVLVALATGAVVGVLPGAF